VPTGTELNSILSIQVKRVVRKDGTVVFEGRLYQLSAPG
jgi:hypothetical protein